MSEDLCCPAAEGVRRSLMTVRGITELASWILSLGPWVEVLRPPALRTEVGDLLASAAALYAGRKKA